MGNLKQTNIYYLEIKLKKNNEQNAIFTKKKKKLAQNILFVRLFNKGQITKHTKKLQALKRIYNSTSSNEKKP